ncbi:hypothetical protein [Eubacterium sp.]|uniref:hypothetical protein n=1 Tax=Eubacterium sp. TaxID=142586 RepID=UPI0026E0F791|nr:hypothetical protein [Eubacterium sp.]MDO5433833.1 hypothetical protein [Eubacterium sp.]
MGKKKKYAEGFLIEGLTESNGSNVWQLSIEDGFLKLNETSGIVKRKSLKVYKIDLSKVITIDTINKENIYEKKKSVIGRGLTGAVLFGPAGAVLGGMSGIGTKEQKVNVSIFSISFYGNNESDIKTILFDKVANWDMFDAIEQEFKEKHREELKTSENGEILL